MTILTKGQVIVHSLEEIIKAFEDLNMKIAGLTHILFS
jgi:hypothetical protein